MSTLGYVSVVPVYSLKHFVTTSLYVGHLGAPCQMLKEMMRAAMTKEETIAMTTRQDRGFSV